jgi:hypothetical protein
MQLATNQQKIGPFTQGARVLLEVYTMLIAKSQEGSLISTPMTPRAKDMGCVAYHLAHVTHICPIRGRGLLMHVHRHTAGFEVVAKRSPLTVCLFGVRHVAPRGGRLPHVLQV